jgi:hypothetical protein
MEGTDRELIQMPGKSPCWGPDKKFYEPNQADPFRWRVVKYRFRWQAISTVSLK